MWTRYELKDRAKVAFRANYLYCVLMSLIIMLLTGGLAGGSGVRINYDVDDQGRVSGLWNAWESLSSGARFGIIAGLAGAAGLGIVISFMISIFLRNPAMVGCRRFFFLNTYAPAQLNEIGYSFSGDRYRNIVKTMFRVDLSILLWSLLFVIPGIVKNYSYLMVPYIMAEDPNVDSVRAMQISEDMMRGNKWAAFVLELSFIGWHLLSVLTLGLLEIFWVMPYINATQAELYRVLRDRYQQSVQASF